VSDDPGIQSQGIASSETAAEPKTGVKGFLSTTVGKVVVGCLGASILLAIIGVVVFFALASFGVGLLGQATNQATQGTGSTVVVPPGGGAGAGGSKPATSAVPSVVATPNVLTVTDDEVFTPRDPFIPVILPSPEPTSTSDAEDSAGELTAGSSNGSITTPDSNALFLRLIMNTANGAIAVLDYKGTIYMAGAGDAIPNSPWKVVSVGTKTVTMLFGDERVTVALGEGIQSK
jgi:hypothetical protein